MYSFSFGCTHKCVISRSPLKAYLFISSILLPSINLVRKINVRHQTIWANLSAGILIKSSRHQQIWTPVSQKKKKIICKEVIFLLISWVKLSIYLQIFQMRKPWERILLYFRKWIRTKKAKKEKMPQTWLWYPHWSNTTMNALYFISINKW